MSKIANEILKDAKVMGKIYPKIERGKLVKINATVIHQTNFSSAEQIVLVNNLETHSRLR